MFSRRQTFRDLKLQLTEQKSSFAMPIQLRSTDEMSGLIITGWITLSMLYGVQCTILIVLMEKQFGESALWFILPYTIVIIVTYVSYKKEYNGDDESFRGILISWSVYMVLYVVSVVIIFLNIANKLTKHDTLGPNVLKSSLCITPAMLILFLQLTIDSNYRKSVLFISLLAALDIFDGIEMLEVFLMQNEGYFDLNESTEKSIIAFACICFLLTSLGLARHKFDDNGEIKEKTRTSIVFGCLQVFFTNLPFLVIRAVIWGVHGHESAVFIAKNAVASVIWAIECRILFQELLLKRNFV